MSLGGTVAMEHLGTIQGIMFPRIFTLKMMSGMETDITVPARQKKTFTQKKKKTTENAHCKVLSKNNMCL